MAHVNRMSVHNETRFGESASGSELSRRTTGAIFPGHPVFADTLHTRSIHTRGAFLASGSDPTCCVSLHSFEVKKNTWPKAMHITVFEGLTSRDSCYIQLQGCV